MSDEPSSKSRATESRTTESRAAARERITSEIMEAARNQLADVGAAALSLRSIAREIGMVSSAVYRYVKSRDDLLTRLIIDAYDSLGAAAESAAARDHPSDLDRWVATTAAIRDWSLSHPHEHLLLYGSPVPGYAAPDDTVVPGTRVTLALVTILSDASASGRLVPAPLAAPIPQGLRSDLAQLADTVGASVPPATVLAFLISWTQLFGLIGFELTHQTRNMVGDHAELFTTTTRQTGTMMGLQP